MVLLVLAFAAQAQRIALGNFHTLSVHANGTLWAWGYNGYGSLGTGTTSSTGTPVAVGTAITWQAASGGYLHSAALRQDGTLWTWGLGGSGPLGLGAPWVLTPAYVADGGAPLATTPISAEVAWQLAPNPTHGWVRLLGRPAGTVQGQLYDGQGRLLRQFYIPGLDVTGLPTGLYLLRVATGSATRTLRLQVE